MYDLLNPPPQEHPGKIARDKGIAQAEETANKLVEGWSDTAFDFLKNYVAAQRHGYEFQTEDIRMEAENYGVPEPANKRARGAIILKAKRAGLIQYSKTKQVKNPKAHCAYSSVWIKV